MSNTSSAIDAAVSASSKRRARTPKGTELSTTTTGAGNASVSTEPTADVAVPVKPSEVAGGEVTESGITASTIAPNGADGAELEPDSTPNELKLIAGVDTKIAELNDSKDIAASELELTEKKHAAEKNAKRRETLSTAIDRQRNALNKIIQSINDQDKRKASLIDIGMKRAIGDANKAAKAKAEQEAKAAMTAIAKAPRYDEYVVTGLTTEQALRREALETEARGYVDGVRKNLIDFVKVATQIKEEKLYHDIAGGFDTYIEMTFNFSRSTFNRMLIMANVTGELTTLDALPVPPVDENGDRISLDPKQLPEKESHIRVLNQAGDTSDKAKAWHGVQKRAKGGEVVTGTLVTEEVNKVRKAKGLPPVLTPNGAKTDGQQTLPGTTEETAPNGTAVEANPVASTAEPATNDPTNIPESAWRAANIAQWRGVTYLMVEEIDTDGGKSYKSSVLNPSPTLTAVYSGGSIKQAKAALQAQAGNLTPDEFGDENEGIAESDMDEAAELTRVPDQG